MSGHRRLCSMLLLAAVFVMHGVQCMVADPEGGHAPTAPALASTAMEHPSGPDAVADGVAAGLVITPAVMHAVAGPLGAGLPVDRDLGHNADLWAVCLAVTGGLVLLAALGLSRRGAVTPVRGSPFRLVGTAIIAGPLRPPDLSSLCLLRI